MQNISDKQTNKQTNEFRIEHAKMFRKSLTLHFIKSKKI